MRHLNTNYLWVQERSAKKDVVYAKVSGTENIADLMTKHLDGATLRNLTSKLSTELRSDKSDIALDLDSVVGHVNYIKERLTNKYDERRSLCVCTRRDRASLTHRGSAKGGPPLNTIRYRITLNNNSGGIVSCEEITDGKILGQHRLLLGEATDVTTMLLYDDCHNQRTVSSA